MPWGADSYSPVDLTLLDPHFGNIQMWRRAIEEMHKRGIYVVLDNTMATSVLPIGQPYHGRCSQIIVWAIYSHSTAI